MTALAPAHKMTAEQFFEAHEAAHPLQEGSTLGQWIEWMTEGQKAYAEYDPEASAKLTLGLDFGKEPAAVRLTMAEWERIAKDTA